MSSGWRGVSERWRTLQGKLSPWGDAEHDQTTAVPRT